VDLDADESELTELYERSVSRAEGLGDYWLTWFAAEEAQERAAARRDARLRLTEGNLLDLDVESLPNLTSPFSKDAYMDAVRSIQRYISQGDVFQVNLSVRQSKEVAASPEELYEWLRLINPSPYMGFLRCPDFQLVSASPELLVELAGSKLAARPIAGTRRRGRSAEEDEQLAEELRSNEKERAEHIMLVDLERNDLGRISAYGSVKVEELMVIERYSHVMHLVSQVEGTLAEGKDAFDVIEATFPGGTITGAPKIRTMEIIEELEPVRRGPYTGSLGWIDYSGDMTFNIIIRTMAVQEGVVHIQAGAGIVIDSIPEREYKESLNKAKALWKAVQYSEQFALAGSAGNSDREGDAE
jgi:para-aminobenzoate synthetase component 1